jgi:hypothetical protein
MAALKKSLGQPNIKEATKPQPAKPKRAAAVQAAKAPRKRV